MKKLELTKVIARTLIVASVLSLNPIGANAEWKKDVNGWWNTEGNSWSIGLRQIDGKWYYFNDKGYMVTNKAVDGWYFNSNGVGTAYVKIGDFAIDKSTGTIIKFFRNDAYHRPGINIPISVVIPMESGDIKIKCIGANTFDGCANLASVIIPDSVKSIGYFAFNGCSGLTSITIPDSVTSIGDAAFCGCNKLTSITIPKGVTTISNWTFRDCSGLTSITIPDGVTSIGRSAFDECSNLTSITIPDSVTSISDCAFSRCNNAIFYVGNEDVKYALHWGSNIDNNKIIVKS